MKFEINKLIEAEKEKLGNDKKKIMQEAEKLNIDIAIYDHEDVDEVEMIIKMMARIRKLKELNAN